jgi:hypothetical protein
MDAYTTTNIDLVTGNGREPIVAPFSKDYMSGIDNFRNVVMPRYCPSCDDRRRVRLGSYSNFDENEELSTPDELEMPDFTSGGSSSTGSTSSTDCTFWQKISGQCKDASTGTNRQQRCKDKYPNDFDAYKKCLAEQGSNIGTTISNIGNFLTSIFGGQAAANAGNYPPPADDESTGMSTGAKIGIGLAVAGVVGIIVYQLVKKPKK